MDSFLERYQRGECERVWLELQALGERVREEPVYSDALAVARETMRRVRYNCALLRERLQMVGYKFGYDWAPPILVARVLDEPPALGTPLADIQERLQALEQAGAVFPLSLRAFYEIVGSINFVGVCSPAVDRFEFGDDAVDEDDDEDMLDEELDPLYIKGLDEVLVPEIFQRWSREDRIPYSLVISYDAASKYFLSDLDNRNSFLVEIPCHSADVHLIGEDGYGPTFVSYLRYNLQRGGLPGTPQYPGLGQKALAYVTRDLLPL
jgi:hypothetical protein